MFKRICSGLIGLALLTSCTTSVGTAPSSASPEALIAGGATSVTATATLAMALLREEKITLDQASGFRVLLGASSDALGKMNATLTECRTRTGSTAKTFPDPCKLGVVDVIQISLEGVANVKRALDAKK